MKAPARFHSLDALRGFSALSVVLYHWRFWATADPTTFPHPFNTDVLPASSVLGLFYNCGYSAVGLFFSLSGFVFYWLYRDSIGARRVGAWVFAVARFSRLYPLHFATLLFVAAGQAAYAAMNHGAGWMFRVNDVQSFVKHLLIFPLWTRHRSFAFNTPVWTLVIEALLYLLFFVCARLRAAKITGTLVMLVAAYYVRSILPDIGYGMNSFFMGGLAYLVFERIDSPSFERGLRILLGVSWPVAFVLGSQIINLWTTQIYWLDNVYAQFVLYPATILYLACAEARKGSLGARLGRVGDLTYSSYLLHFPLMLTIALALRAMGRGPDVMLTIPGLLGYFAVLIPLSLLCHRRFERPVQTWLRDRLTRRRRVGDEATGLAAVSTFD